MKALLGGEAPHTGIAALDLDGDRDLDLVLPADGSAPLAVINDRLGNFHEVVLKDLALAQPVSGILVMDLDQDGRADLVAPSTHGKLLPLRNTTERTAAGQTRITFEPFATSAGAWRAAIAADLDLDGLPDLLGLPAADAKAPAGGTPALVWARNESKRLTARELLVTLETPGVEGLALADLVGDPLPDLLVARAVRPPPWPATWATATTGWPCNSAATGGSSPS